MFNKDLEERIERLERWVSVLCGQNDKLVKSINELKEEAKQYKEKLNQ